MFEALLTQIASQLDDGAVPYMVIGGQAVLLYGEPRLTKDIDVTLGATLERLPEILPLVEAMGLETVVDPEQFTRQTMVLPCRDPDIEMRVDFIFSFSAYAAQALERARSVELADADVRFASLKDVKGMLIKNPGADFDYVRIWLKDFAASLGEPFQERFEQLVEASR